MSRFGHTPIAGNGLRVYMVAILYMVSADRKKRKTSVISGRFGKHKALSPPEMTNMLMSIEKQS